MNCNKCGNSISDNMKFCPQCGCSLVNEQDSYIVKNSRLPVGTSPKDIQLTASNTSLKEKAKTKIVSWWKSLSLYSKIIFSTTLFNILLLVITILLHKNLSIVFAIIALFFSILSFSIHKGIVDFAQAAFKYVALIVSFIAVVASIWTFKPQHKNAYKYSPSTVSSKTNNSIQHQISHLSSSSSGEVTDNLSSKDIVGTQYTAIIQKLFDKGFTDIEYIELDDIVSADNLNLNEKIARISIDGNDSFESIDAFPFDSHVAVEYHTKKKIALELDFEEVKSLSTSQLKSKLSDMGFVRITCKEIADIPNSSSDYHENQILVNGNKDFSTLELIPFDSEISIITHTGYNLCDVSIDVDFESNLLFSTYDVEVSIGNGSSYTLTHGQDSKLNFQTDEDEYTLLFSKVNDSSINGSYKFKACGSTSIKCSIKCRFDIIDLKITYFQNDEKLDDSHIRICNDSSSFIGKKHDEVYTNLESLGFTNITEQIVYDIASNSSLVGETRYISIDGSADIIPGTVYSQDAPIVITYRMLESENPDIKPNIDDDFKVCILMVHDRSIGSYSVIFENSKGEYEFNEPITSKMIGITEEGTENRFPSWIYQGATVHLSGMVRGNKLIEAVVTKPETDKCVEIPVMIGADFDQIQKQLTNLGLKIVGSQYFNDETKHISYSSHNGGLTLDLVVSLTFNEILYADFVSFNGLSTSQEQKDFLIKMAPYLCPSKDSEEISKWMSDNMGKEANKELNGFTYRLFIDSNDDICFTAGEDSWAKWDSEVSGN